MSIKLKYSLTAAFTALSFWFWTFLSPGALRFLEVTQFFPFTWTHLKEALLYPGGLIEYASEFFVQFFLYAPVAGFIVSAALALLQILSWKVMESVLPKKNDVLFPLSFVPAFCGWAFLCLFGSMFTAILALISVIGAYLFNLRFRDKRSKIISLTVGTAILYYASGPLSIVYVALSLIEGLKKKEKSEIITSCCAVFLWTLMPFLWNQIVQYPVKELFLGTDYCLAPGKCTIVFCILSGSTALMTFICAIVPGMKNDKVLFPIVFGILSVAVIASGWIFVIKTCNPLRERIYEYDKLCYDRNWKGVIIKGRGFPPVSLAEISAINLALAEQGKLLDEMFNFPQPGPGALFPDYASGYIVSLTAGEAVYHAGLLNTARHYAFEEYESYPNYRISSRHLKRLAEVDLINGNYAVAGRYLKSLGHTLFYGKWARRYLDDPEAIKDNPEYEGLMQYRDTSEFLYNDSSDEDKRLMLRRIVDKSVTRSVASDYLIAYDLLARDLFSFKSDIAKVHFGGDAPEYVQEGIILLGKADKDESYLDNPLVKPETIKKFNDFQLSLVEGKSGGWIKANFGATYMYYFSSGKK